MVLENTAEALPVQEQIRDEAYQSVELLVFEKRNRWASIVHEDRHQGSESSVPGLRQGYNEYLVFSSQFMSSHALKVPASTVFLGFGEKQVECPFVLQAWPWLSCPSGTRHLGSSPHVEPPRL